MKNLLERKCLIHLRLVALEKLGPRYRLASCRDGDLNNHIYQMRKMDNQQGFLALFRGKISLLNQKKVESPAGQPKTPNANLKAKSLAISSTKASPWERLPIEVRQQIFDNLDEELIYVCISQTHPNPAPKPRPYFRWSDSMPPLVVALRSLPVSYGHAIQHFARVNWQLDLGFGCNIASMTKSELGVITFVRFEVG
jgi:hypothetical protein